MSFQLRHFSDYGLQMESIDNLSVYDSSFLEQMTAVPKVTVFTVIVSFFETKNNFVINIVWAACGH